MKKKRRSRNRDHDKFLARMGVTPEKMKEVLYANGERVGVNDIPDYTVNSSTKTSDTVDNGYKKEKPKYTGNLIMGIATMHKSNIVPVMRGTDQAKEIAKMRRN